MAALNQTIEDIRRYIFDLRAAEQTRELETVLANLVQDLRLDTMLEVDLEVKGQRCCWLPPEQVSHVTQIAREAFSNIVQHAGASHVSVMLSYEGQATQLIISDDGRGMAPDLLAGDHQPGTAHNGHGIDNMQARAHALGGTLDLEIEQGQGFKLVLTLPCDGDKGAEPIAEETVAWA